MSFASASRVHFIGIGGAGMSAIAKVLIEGGIHVSGSDLKTSRTTTVLAAMGAQVHMGHEAGNIGDADLVVASSAIPPTNPELGAARAAGIEVMGRGEALAALLEGRRSIVVAGTHGKTTTTSMIVSIARAAGLDPTFLVGGGLNDSGTNARAGSGELAIAESDESDGSFLLLTPHIGVITNIEMDHVDHWGSLDELNAAFDRFMSSVDPSGALVVPAGNDIEARARATGRRVMTFGEGGDVQALSIDTAGDATTFSLNHAGDDRSLELRTLGLHNVSNALAAAAAALCADVGIDDVAAGLAAFRGVERRFDHKGTVGGVSVVDDYAHHPTEVRATLAAARSGPWKRVVAIFQPHRYSRTAALYREFGASFADADRIVITDVYGAGEEPVPGISGKLIADAVCWSVPGRGVAYLPHRADVLAYLHASARPGDLVLTLGAGDVTAIGSELLHDLEQAR